MINLIVLFLKNRSSTFIVAFVTSFKIYVCVRNWSVILRFYNFFSVGVRFWLVGSRIGCEGLTSIFFNFEYFK
jgi:hypothetical protein